jgi:copper chaperone CopZ
LPVLNFYIFIGPDFIYTNLTEKIMTRTKLTLSLLLCLVIIAASCGGGKGKGSQETPETPAATATVSLAIEGMTCTGCENTICTSLEKVPGVKSVTASFTDGKAVIEYETGKVDTAKLKEAVDASGYKALKVSAVEGEEKQ